MEAECAAPPDKGAEPLGMAREPGGEPGEGRPVPRPVVDHEVREVGGQFLGERGIVSLAKNRHLLAEPPGETELVEHEVWDGCGNMLLMKTSCMSCRGPLARE